MVLQPRVAELICRRLRCSIFGRNILVYRADRHGRYPCSSPRNTSYATFHVPTSLIARDRWSATSVRLCWATGWSFSNGDHHPGAVLGIALVVYFKASTTNLIPLYAGVFRFVHPSGRDGRALVPGKKYRVGSVRLSTVWARLQPFVVRFSVILIAVCGRRVGRHAPDPAAGRPVSSFDRHYDGFSTNQPRRKA